MKNKLILLFALLIFLQASCEKEEPRIGKTSAVFNPDKVYGTVKDIDGNVYKTITIGSQTWMAENLRVTHYSNGDPVPNVKDNTKWSQQTSGAYCSYENTRNPDTIATYGLLYNGYAVLDSSELAPEGWHIPSDEEWSTLVATIDAGDGTTDQYGSNSIAGGRMKEAGTRHWGYPNRFADNSSGFTAIPNGIRWQNPANFSYWHYDLSYWSSTEWNTIQLYYRGINTDFASIRRQPFGKVAGMSVRCIKDQ
jgi:uncharacterized protein (TIGR02145 family)